MIALKMVCVSKKPHRQQLEECARSFSGVNDIRGTWDNLLFGQKLFLGGGKRSFSVNDFFRTFHSPSALRRSETLNGRGKRREGLLGNGNLWKWIRQL